MDALFQSLEYWHWLLAAVVFITLEIFSPGVFFLWMGISAAIIGSVTWLQPDLIWEWQFVIFAILTIFSAVFGQKILYKNQAVTDQPNLNRRSEQYVGRIFTLDEPIVNGVGKVKVDDSTWKIEGPACEAGSQVKVVGADGVILKVECL